MLNSVLWNRQITRKKQITNIYNSIVKSTVTYSIKNRVNKGTAVTAMLNIVLWNRQITRNKQITNI